MVNVDLNTKKNQHKTFLKPYLALDSNIFDPGRNTRCHIHCWTCTLWFHPLDQWLEFVPPLLSSWAWDAELRSLALNIFNYQLSKIQVNKTQNLFQKHKIRKRLELFKISRKFLKKSFLMKIWKFSEINRKMTYECKIRYVPTIPGHICIFCPHTLTLDLDHLHIVH